MPYEVLLLQLSDEDEDVRLNAAWILGQLGVKDAVEPLQRLLAGSKSSRTRHTAAIALGKIRDPRASPVLLECLRDEDILVRMGAAIGLRLLRDPASVESLQAAVEMEERAELRSCLTDAIRAVSGMVHRQKSALDKKIEKSRREVESHPDDGTAHNNLGVAYYHNRQYDLALKHCERAKALGAGVKWLEDRLVGHRRGPTPGPRRRRSGGGRRRRPGQGDGGGDDEGPERGGASRKDADAGLPEGHRGPREQ